MSASAAPGLRIRVAPVAVVLLAAGVAWLGVAAVARHMGPMPGTMGVGLGSFVAIWALMMAAMMLPSVSPFVSMYARTIKERRPARLTALVAGYLAVWAVAGVPAFGLAWLADRAVAGHPAAATGLAVAVFAACGIYQLTPLKERCLARCRTPLGFVFKFASYRGSTRDVRVGLYHGGYCLACCWSLMALLVAFGLMNLTAMLVLTAVVLAEKLGPWPRGLSQVVGVVALGLAVAVLIDPSIAAGLHQMPMQGGQMSNMSS
jgi:predicted metal-binding membrane protein